MNWLSPHSVAADPPTSRPERVPLCPLSCLSHLSWVPTDFFPSNGAGLDPHPTPPPRTVLGSSGSRQLSTVLSGTQLLPNFEFIIITGIMPVVRIMYLPVGMLPVY